MTDDILRASGIYRPHKILTVLTFAHLKLARVAANKYDIQCFKNLSSYYFLYFSVCWCIFIWITCVILITRRFIWNRIEIIRPVRILILRLLIWQIVAINCILNFVKTKSKKSCFILANGQGVRRGASIWLPYIIILLSEKTTSSRIWDS